jgi:hypothetical protein
MNLVEEVEKAQAAIRARTGYTQRELHSRRIYRPVWDVLSEEAQKAWLETKLPTELLCGPPDSIRLYAKRCGVRL